MSYYHYFSDASHPASPLNPINFETETSKLLNVASNKNSNDDYTDDYTNDKVSSKTRRILLSVIVVIIALWKVAEYFNYFL
jgi:hypothetical protein